MENKNRTIKKYRTARGNLNTFVSVGDKVVRVKFVSRDNKEGFFITSDAALQKALEEDKDFGIKYMLANATVDMAEDRQPQYTEITSVTTWQQAKEFLHSRPYSIPLRSLATPEKIRKAAQTKGLKFPCIAE